MDVVNMPPNKIYENVFFSGIFPNMIKDLPPDILR